MKTYILILSIFIFIGCSGKPSEVNHEIGSKDSLNKKATFFYKNKDYSNALNFYDKLISIDSTNGEFYYKRGNCKAYLFDYNGSTNDYLKAIELKYKIGDTYFNIACNYASIKEDSLALKYFTKAYEINPNDLNLKTQIELVKERLKATTKKSINVL
jgi:tetratricopeptide (TPR) repeat protein